ncbi:neuropeptide B [Hemitrygon akajei]|uniref:neuropeptide B n=1 Tax=Hemitrygon akajei TaxID=2704970 RepID=UPI003BFA1952
MPALETLLKMTLACVILSSLVPSPAEAWYKQATGPSYYSVGRASGLLSGIRRSPYVRRSEAGEAAESAESSVMSEQPGQGRAMFVKNMAVCVKDISPSLHTCQLHPDGFNTFQCKADVFLSLDSQDCGNV